MGSTVMIDTVKIAVSYSKRPDWLRRIQASTKRNATTGVVTTIIDANKSYRRIGVYVPTLLYIEQPATKDRKRTYTLNIELSLPKLFFGNNFDELTDNQFAEVVHELHKRLRNVYGLRISEHKLAQSDVAKIDYSKNIIFTDRTPVSTIINAIALANISKTYDVQKTDFRNGGQIYHIHANVMDIVIYDKATDLQQAKISEKRTVEKYNQSQIKLVEELEKHPNITIPRFEIRLNDKRKIRSELKAINANEDLRFCHVFSTAISGAILLRHWNKIFNQIPKAEMVADTATQILVALKQANPSTKFAEASSLALMTLLRKEAQDERSVRNLIESLFSKSQYTRLKNNGRFPPTKTQLKSLLQITKTITAMTPVKIEDFVK